ncbi:hypothetical protein QJS04_geneDACA009779 [Acorus gramineus]|uniref:Uncharacterized protein n=1 Tax=Acorus gramineus TaxID=55184 RepID=A0AAV9B8L7_ACOGR|nr:hypothetical protein QJS04_geneDACA009779 [Acorus gramineus]
MASTPFTPTHSSSSVASNPTSTTAAATTTSRQKSILPHSVASNPTATTTPAPTPPPPAHPLLHLPRSCPLRLTRPLRFQPLWLTTASIASTFHATLHRINISVLANLEPHSNITSPSLLLYLITRFLHGQNSELPLRSPTLSTTRRGSPRTGTPPRSPCTPSRPPYRSHARTRVSSPSLQSRTTGSAPARTRPSAQCHP